jgi:3-oxoacyl-[acyl-carrier-protein] synthase-3
MTPGIVDIAIATPGEHVANDYFDSIGLTDEWIRRRTGVGARWWMDPAEPLEDVARGLRTAGRAAPRSRGYQCTAGRQQLHGREGSRIAQRVAKQAGLPTNVLAFDMNAACSGSSTA